MAALVHAADTDTEAAAAAADQQPAAYSVHQGRPEVAAWLEHAVVDSTVVYVCGPHGLRRAVTDAARTLSAVVISETFEL
jgi:ferredoxin-NADP reductase